jgi:hypothetical protein
MIGFLCVNEKSNLECYYALKRKKCPKIIGCENFLKDSYYILCYVIDLSEIICLRLCIWVNDQGDDE